VDQELRALLKLDEVNTALFENVAWRARHPVWSSSAFKPVIWSERSISRRGTAAANKRTLERLHSAGHGITAVTLPIGIGPSA
jgi:hypothetical protein